jgi:hypothetical protein
MSCSAGLPKVITSKKTTDIPVGTEVKFNKIINPSFAEKYIGAEIVTYVEFYDTNPVKSTFLKIPNGYIAFRAVNIGESETIDQWSATNIFLPENKSDLIFELKKGQKIKLTGGTHIVRAETMGMKTEVISILAKTIEIK